MPGGISGLGRHDESQNEPRVSRGIYMVGVSLKTACPEGDSLSDAASRLIVFRQQKAGQTTVGQGGFDPYQRLPARDIHLSARHLL
jgi:hypothetical protein